MELNACFVILKLTKNFPSLNVGVGVEKKNDKEIKNNF